MCSPVSAPSVSVCVLLCTVIHFVYVCAYMFVSVCVLLCISVYILCMCVCVHVCECVCILVYICVYSVYVCERTCLWVCIVVYWCTELQRLRGDSPVACCNAVSLPGAVHKACWNLFCSSHRSVCVCVCVCVVLNALSLHPFEVVWDLTPRVALQLIWWRRVAGLQRCPAVLPVHHTGQYWLTNGDLWLAAFHWYCASTAILKRLTIHPFSL